MGVAAEPWVDAGDAVGRGVEAAPVGAGAGENCVGAGESAHVSEAAAEGSGDRVYEGSSVSGSSEEGASDAGTGDASNETAGPVTPGTGETDGSNASMRPPILQPVMARDMSAAAAHTAKKRDFKLYSVKSAAFAENCKKPLWYFL